MAQHDFVIDNAAGAAVRADLNLVLQAIVTNNAGATAPSTTYPNMWWYDTANSQLKRRNNANTDWIVLGLEAASTDGTFAANSDSLVPTQKAAKTYSDTKISKTTTNEINSMTEKSAPVSADVVVLEDSAASYGKKKAQVGNLSSDKISKTTAGEINAMTEKTTPVNDDILLLEDSAASYAKKKVKISSLAGKYKLVETETWTAYENRTISFPVENNKMYRVFLTGRIATSTSGNPPAFRFEYIRFNSDTASKYYDKGSPSAAVNNIDIHTTDAQFYSVTFDVFTHLSDWAVDRAVGMISNGRYIYLQHGQSATPTFNAYGSGDFHGVYYPNNSNNITTLQVYLFRSESGAKSTGTASIYELVTD